MPPTRRRRSPALLLTVLLSLATTTAGAQVTNAAPPPAAARPVTDTARRDTTPERQACSVPRPNLDERPRNDRKITRCLPRLQIFADGNVKDVLGSKDVPASISGALGMRYSGNLFDVTGLVNVAGTSDTVTSGYGATLLVPAAGRGLNAASLTIRRRLHPWMDPTCARHDYGLTCNAGIRVNASASTRRWATGTRDSVPEGQTDTIRIVTAEDVPMWGLGVGVWYAFFDDYIETSDGEKHAVAMLLDLGVIRRAIRGDIAGDSEEREQLRDSLLTTTKTHFDGFEIGLSLVYDELRSNFTYYYLNRKVEGLSRGQIVATVEIRAPLSSGLLKRR